MMTPAEFYEHTANIWARCAWRAAQYCYDLFIEDQMNEGIDPNDGTRYGEEVTLADLEK